RPAGRPQHVDDARVEVEEYDAQAEDEPSRRQALQADREGQGEAPALRPPSHPRQQDPQAEASAGKVVARLPRQGEGDQAPAPIPLEELPHATRERRPEDTPPPQE